MTILMNKLLLLLLLVVLFQACKEDTKLESSNKNSIEEFEKFAPHPDHSSPEQLVKTFWKYRIWSDTVYRFDTTSTLYKFYSQEFYDKGSSIAKKKISEFKEKGHYLTQSVIDKIEPQSDSRVIIYVKELGYKDDKNFDTQKYVIVKENNKWFIEDYLSECWSCEGTGKDKYGSHSDCEYCKGLGWRSMIYIQ